jgi:hypothetical protein
LLRHFGAGLSIALGASAVAAAPAWAQLTFPGASPISAGNVVLRVQPEISEAGGGFRSLFDRNVLIYGASPSLAFLLQNNSVVSNSVDVDGRRLTATGIGDTLFQTRYTIFQQDGIGSTFRVAPIIGIDMPTGMADANGAGPRGTQPGTGAWNTRDALTASWQTLYWNGGAEAGYQANSTAGGYHFGNTFYADLGFHYLLWPSSLEGEVGGEFYASLEANYTSSAANFSFGQTVGGTGSQLLLVDPGVIWTTALYSVSFTALLPAYERIAPNGGRYGYGAALFFRRSFFTDFHW